MWCLEKKENNILKQTASSSDCVFPKLSQIVLQSKNDSDYCSENRQFYKEAQTIGTAWLIISNRVFRSDHLSGGNLFMVLKSHHDREANGWFYLFK